MAVASGANGRLWPCQLVAAAREELAMEWTASVSDYSGSVANLVLALPLLQLAHPALRCVTDDAVAASASAASVAPPSPAEEPQKRRKRIERVRTSNFALA